MFSRVRKYIGAKIREKKIHVSRHNLGYRELLEGFEILSLEDRRKIALLTYLQDMLQGRITDSHLLEKINIQVARITSRMRNTFRPSTSRTNIMKFSILNRASELYNHISGKNPELDIFHINRQQFKSELTQILSLPSTSAGR